MIGRGQAGLTAPDDDRVVVRHESFSFGQEVIGIVVVVRRAGMVAALITAPTRAIAPSTR